MNKSYAILTMSERLRKGELIYIGETCIEFNISVPTFRRYMSMLRNFFWDTDLIEIEYNITKKGYQIKK